MTRASDPNTPRDAAFVYAARGWPVFPLRPRDKTPLTSNGFKAATVDRATIRGWWDTYPDANIGIPTGRAFDVLDIDGAHGLERLHAKWAELGITYRHNGPVAHTGKGWHLLFQPTGFGNATSLIEPDSKLDFRGIGGYIVVSPSIHPLGHAYRWDQDRPDTTPLPEPPDWLKALLYRDDNPAVHSPTRTVILPNTTYADLVNGGVIPKADVPRGLRLRFERPDILDVCATRGIALRRRGRYFVTNCTYHDDSTPSMAVYPKNNTFYCFGCQAHGDSYDLMAGTHI